MDRQQFPLFPQTQLPPPSQLHLPPPHSSSSFRSNTLPPLSPLAAAGSSRFPPASFHPSLSSPYSTNSQLPWPPHRTSSAREDLKPHPPPNDTQKGKANERDMSHLRERSFQDKDIDDGMPPTSDFVKKLFKYVFTLHYCTSDPPPGCSRTIRLPTLCAGAPVVTASSSRFAPSPSYKSKLIAPRI